jgi:hypothetical protein
MNAIQMLRVSNLCKGPFDKATRVNLKLTNLQKGDRESSHLDVTELNRHMCKLANL